MMRPDSYYCFLETYEFAAVEAVYAAGLRPGDSRQDFINAGLIEPEAQPNVHCYIMAQVLTQAFRIRRLGNA